MEFFKEAKAVKLKSNLEKYLVADDDQISVRQSRNGDARRARWLVETVDSNPHVIRLKSCFNHYLTASEDHFLLGTTGHKVLQTPPESQTKNLTIEWQPIRDGFQIKLRSSGGTYLRANGGAPPWRNSVTHDTVPNTRDRVVWDVEAVEVTEEMDYWSMVKSFSSLSDDTSTLDLADYESPVYVHCESPASVRSVHSGAGSPFSAFSLKKRFMRSKISSPRTSAMDMFQFAKVIRLKSVHDKYLTADEDEESVTQERNGSAKAAKWTVEFVENSDHVIRLRSCYNKYLTASNNTFLLGMTGRKVIQTQPKRVDSSVEWEPVKEGGVLKLKTRYGQYLRANGGLPPWRNSVTHDIPHRTATQEWISWEVHVVEILETQSPTAAEKEDSFTSESESPSPMSLSASFSVQESNESSVNSPPKNNEGRLIYFHISDESGEVDQGFEELCISFKGNGVDELRARLEVELGIEGITVCTRSPLNGKLYPLRLQFPPNNNPMHVVVLPPSEDGADHLVH